MNETANVKLANHAIWSTRLTRVTPALTEANGANKTRYPGAHAPRSGKPKNATLTCLHFDISSTSELNSATHRLRASECAPPSLRPMDRIRASYQRRIGHSPTDQVSQIRRPIWSRGRTAHSSHPLPGLSVDSYSRYQLVAYCGPKSTQLRSKRRVDSAQTKAIPVPIPRPVHRVAFTTLQLAPTITHFRSNLPGARTTAALIKSAAINPEQNREKSA